MKGNPSLACALKLAPLSIRASRTFWSTLRCSGLLGKGSSSHILKKLLLSFWIRINVCVRLFKIFKAH